MTKKEGKRHLGFVFCLLFFLLFFSTLLSLGSSQTVDAAAMLKLRDSLGDTSVLGWTDSDPCKWEHVTCSNNRVNRIQLSNNLNLRGTLPAELRNLTELQVFEVMNNQLSGGLPSLSGLSSLQTLNVHTNNFTSIPSDFFEGMTALTNIFLDSNPFQPWEIPVSLTSATSLQQFSANGCNVTGAVPAFFNADVFPGLEKLHLSFNMLEGGLPSNFSGSSIQSLWLNGQTSRYGLNGTLSVLQNMTSLTEVWLNMNKFTGPLPDFSKVSGLQDFNVRDNMLTGVVPDSLTSLSTLVTVNLTNNKLQGPTPRFSNSVQLDNINGSNSFCLPGPGASCDPRVNVLLSIAKDFGYPQVFADGWKGNDPCTMASSWVGITCDPTNTNITVINFQRKGLSGTISTNFSSIPTLRRLILSNNLITGTIPNELTNLPNLEVLDVSNNRLYGKVPSFRSNVQVVTSGNPDIGKDSSSSPPGTPSGGTNSGPGNGSSSGDGSSNNKKSSTGKIVGSVIGVVCGLCVIGLGIFYYGRKRKRTSKVQSPTAMILHPRHSGDQDTVKITIAGSSASLGAESYSNSSGPSDIHVVEAGNMVISIQVLREVTNNFSKENILGQGGFGTVYKGELHDGTKIAVKRMESGVVTEKGLAEFKSEIAVLTKVRHRHLVALLGYCLDGNERLLVYEYMPQGTLSRFLFNWNAEGLRPLEWTRRLTVALDVARGVEYLHGLAHQSFIHRDLKPSNILLGDDMRAKVADFGLVRLAPDGKDGKASIQTRLAGTFGYLAPEYAATGRVTTKVDVFSFGVILMEMIAGRKALDETQPEDSLHLAAWFRRMYNNKETFSKAIDSTIELNEETLASINKVAELACHCTARDPYQRPDMGHVVNILSSLAEQWKPAEPDSDDIYGIDLEMTLPQAVKKWQEFEGSNLDESSSSFFASGDNTQTSIPNRPPGFCDLLQTTDGR